MKSYFLTSPEGILLMPGDTMPKEPHYGICSTEPRPDCFNKPNCLCAEKWKPYREALQAAKASAIPIQDQERAAEMIWDKIGLCVSIYEPNKFPPEGIYGPFTVGYRIVEACQHDSCPGSCLVVDGCEYCKEPVKVAILYDDTPEKEPQEVSITVSKSVIPKNARLVEAYETEHRIIVMFAAGEDIPEDHNCDQMECGSFSHVKYILTKPDSSL